MSTSVFLGTGVSLSSNYYKRHFYASNRDAFSTSTRSEFSKTELSLADSKALRRAAKKLGSFSYSESEDANIRSSVSAFIDTYNNMLNSASASSDSILTHSAKAMVNMTSEYEDKLDKIGITVNSDGTLAKRDLFQTAKLSKFKELFSEDSKYMEQTAVYAKRFQRRADTLDQAEKSAHYAASKNSTSSTTSPDIKTDITDVAQIVAQSMDLNTLWNTGIGSNINLSL